MFMFKNKIVLTQVKKKWIERSKCTQKMHRNNSTWLELSSDRTY
jgi:hypothetical protein